MKFFFTFTRTALGLLRIRLIYLIFLTTIAMFVEGFGISLFLPLLQGTKHDNTINSTMESVFETLHLPFEFRIILLVMVCFFFIKNGLLLVQDMYVARILSSLLVNLRCSLTKRLFQAEYQYLVTKSSGYLNNAITKEFELVTLAFKMYASIWVQLLSIVLYIILPSLINIWVTGIVVLFGIPMALVMKKINALTKQYSLRSVKHGAGLQMLLIQAMSFIKYLKSTASYPKVLQKVETESEHLGQLRYRANVLEAITKYAFEPFAILALALLLFYQVEILEQDMLEIAFLIFLLRRAMSSVLTLQQHFRKFLGTYGSVQVFNALDLELSDQSEPLSLTGTPPDFDQPIIFKNTTFSYAGQSPVLKDLSLTIPSQTTVAFVGESGSGKSTLVNLLTGILRPTQGEIFLGETPYDALQKQELRQRIGYITQENVIFNDTIRNNITLWDTDVSDQHLYQAAEKARIHDFIQTLPKGYHTRLGDGGINISGGQRQRIMIARELCKHSNMLIFDESTSALDTTTEREIQHNIDAFKGEKTIILIAHRLSTVKNADLIYVLKHGAIVGAGTYSELYAQNPEFQRMVDQQDYAAT